MHDSSSVPEEEVRRINEAGGKLDSSARGVDEQEYLPAAKLGVTKINIDTDGRRVWTRVHREFFRDHPEQFDFRPPGKPSWRSTPGLSPTRARNLDQRASSHSFARCSPEKLRVLVNSAHNENAYSRRS